MDRAQSHHHRSPVETELTMYYDNEAADRARRPLGHQRLDAVRRFSAEIEDPSPPILELGTGAGRDVREFVARGLGIVGVDLSIEQARHAQAVGAHQVVATARHLPFRDGNFSALWSMSTLMHVPNGAIRQALAEVRRILAPGAIAGIGVWGGPDVEGYDDRRENGGHRRLFSRRSDTTWRALLELLGEVTTYETWNPDEEVFWYQWALLRVRG